MTVIRTAAELQEAVARGDAHVEIREHLLLTTEQVTIGGFLDHQSSDSTLKSIRVRPQTRFHCTINI